MKTSRRQLAPPGAFLRRYRRFHAPRSRERSLVRVTTSDEDPQRPGASERRATAAGGIAAPGNS